MIERAAPGGSRLEALARLAEEAGAERLVREAHALAGRVRAGLFFVACVGQFKRGKSSLLNALVGTPLLPVGVTPVTAVVTVIRHGPRTTARVRVGDVEWREIAPAELTDYVTEERNPENRRNVTAVEVFVASPLLADGMCLVDTPGIGSIFAGNTEATRAFVPHVDAALVVLGADPPVSADELALIEQLAKQCPDLLFVLNKADRVSDEERAAAVAFTRRVLSERFGGKELPVFETSATERLARTGPPRDWPALVEALGRLARQSGSALVRAAEERGFALLAGQLRHRLDEERDALLRPIEESERRVESLRACVAGAERSLNDLDYLFVAEQDRLARGFAARKTAFLEQSVPAACTEFTTGSRDLPARRGPALRRTAAALAQDLAARCLNTWLAETEPEAEASYSRAMERFVELSDGFLRQLRESEQSALTDLPESVGAQVGFRWDSRLFYKDLWQLDSGARLQWLLDLLRTRRAILGSVDRKATAHIRLLLETNATRIENDLNQRVLESRRRFQFEIRSALTEVLKSAEQAVDRAKERKAQGSTAVEGALERVAALTRRLEELDGRASGEQPRAPAAAAGD
ncbi:MAG: dynamin family protein [Deltaproteobacteria bacterium]|nr:dynamin family protein [Deltaproteobacteria bacterium]